MTWAIRRQSVIGLATVALLVGWIGLWGSAASLAGAVIAQGQIEPQSRAQIIQHPDGGVVAHIAVRDGNPVAAGDVLLTLDGSELGSEHAVLTSQLTELEARSARLMAEQLGGKDVVFPDSLASAAIADKSVAAILTGQRALFEAGKTTYTETVNSLREQQRQKVSEIEGVTAQSVALAEQLELIEAELVDLGTLRAKQLVGAPRVAEMKRARAGIVGEKAATEASIAASHGQIAQLDAEVLRLTSTRQQEAVRERRDVENSIAELSERRRALEVRIGRLGLRSPVDGIVHGLQIHTIGAVIRPADPILHVIPGEDVLTVTAKIDAADVDSVFAGQQAVLRFPNFNARTTPELTASVLRVSADVVTDQRTGAQFYTAELIPAQDQLALLEGKDLLPGMPVEVYIQTGLRSPLSYLLRPFLDYTERAFRD